MNKIREILRLSSHKLGQHQISRSLNISVGTVHKYLNSAEKIGLTWKDAEKMDDKLLIEKLDGTNAVIGVSFNMPDFEQIFKELKKKGITLMLLHAEYKALNPSNHYSYRRFCELYKSWQKDKKICLRQEYKAGDKMFVDYTGPTVPIFDEHDNKVQDAQIFVAVMAASNYTYIEATADQKLESWLNSHVRAFEYFGGVPRLVVPDNLKSGISKACRYEPDLNPNYLDLAHHYDVAVLPARPYKPQDKAKVENAVLVVERWVLARMRNMRFRSLAELNDILKILMAELNQRPLQKTNSSRKELFEEIDAPALNPLPQKVFEYASYYHHKVKPDYHLEIDGHYYSIPYEHVGKEVVVRVTSQAIEVLRDNQRIATHTKKTSPGKTTISGHMPKSHQKHTQWNKEYCLKWAANVGPGTKNFVMQMIKEKPHQDQVSRACCGLARLVKLYTQQRLENACVRAILHKTYSYKNIANILANNLDQLPLATEQKANITPVTHKNVRGDSYYRNANNKEVA